MWEEHRTKAGKQLCSASGTGGKRKTETAESWAEVSYNVIVSDCSQLEAFDFLFLCWRVAGYWRGLGDSHAEKKGENRQCCG